MFQHHIEEQPVYEFVKDCPYDEISDPQVMAIRPLVSVFMVTYLHEPYITEAIESVLKQRVNFPIELIIGEDCSPDNTRTILLEYQKLYPHIIRLILYRKNVGIAKNAILTYLKSRGEYIAIIDGDDYWHNPNKLAFQVEILENRPDIGIVHSGYDFYVQTTNTLIKWDPNNAKSMLDEFHKDYLPYYLSEKLILSRPLTICLRKDLIWNTINDIWQNHRDMSEQIYLSLHTIFPFTKQPKIKFINVSLATYRYRKGSITHPRNVDSFVQFHSSRRDVKIYIARTFNQDELKQKMKYLKIILKASYYFGDNRYLKEIQKGAREIGMKFTLRDRLYYFGAKYRGVFYAVELLRKLKATILGKKPDQFYI